MDLSVIVPCLDEEGNLPALVERVGEVFRNGAAQWPRGAELILVDDGSRDASPQVMAGVAARHPFVSFLRHERNRGIPAAWKTGVARAQGRLVCMLDADLQYAPEDIPRLHRELLSHEEAIVQGWRSPVGRDRGVRYLLSRGLNTVLNRVFSMRLRDNKSAFFICRREVLADLLAYRGSYYHWQVFIMVAAHHKGYAIREIETPFRPRLAGKSAFAGLPVRAVLGVLRDLPRAFVEYRGVG
jgi:phenylacetate-CoA ligase